MKPLLLTATLLLSGCFCWPFNAEDRPDTTHEESYLPYRQPSRDPGYPAMALLRDEGDGYYWELPRHEMGYDDGEPFQWGYRYDVTVTVRYNAVTQHSSRSMSEPRKTLAIDGEPFRLHSISGPFFGGGNRSFVDGKELDCGEQCQSLDEAIAAKKRFDLVCSFGDSPEAPIVVNAVEPPTCYNELDCTVREECCETDGQFICVPWEECPDGRSVGVQRREYDNKRAGEK